MKATDVVLVDPKSYAVYLDIKEKQFEQQEESPEEIAYNQAHMEWTSAQFEYWELKPDIKDERQAILKVRSKIDAALAALETLEKSISSNIPEQEVKKLIKKDKKSLDKST